MTCRCHTVSAFQVRDRLTARLDAIQEVADVPAKLLTGVAGAILDRFGASPRLAVRSDRARAAHRMSARELRNGILRRNERVGGDNEARSRNRQAAARAAERQPRRGSLPGTRFAKRPNRGESRILEKSVLGIGRFAIILQTEAATHRGDGPRRGDVEKPVDDVERVRSKIGNLTAGIIPEPTKVIE